MLHSFDKTTGETKWDIGNRKLHADWLSFSAACAMTGNAQAMSDARA
jgi:hypothetical protein